MQRLQIAKDADAVVGQVQRDQVGQRVQVLDPRYAYPASVSPCQTTGRNTGRVCVYALTQHRPYDCATGRSCRRAGTFARGRRRTRRSAPRSASLTRRHPPVAARQRRPMDVAPHPPPTALLPGRRNLLLLRHVDRLTNVSPAAGQTAQLFRYLDMSSTRATAVHGSSDTWQRATKLYCGAHHIPDAVRAPPSSSPCHG